MATKKFTFDLGNRNLFPSEVAVAEKARALLTASAARHGRHIEGAAVFKITAKMTPAATVDRPQSTDAVEAIGEPVAAVEQGAEGTVEVAPSRPGAHRSY
ncbi:hypothetical protein [Pseudoduganella namucuonensis]|uniref:hypothetical protein n=1 Tax=Pseudoduganella namucuonensis TaxID=1035707 RepID=UPI0011607CEF|nr:hypothetical protein [Pseudoduganella namucuonensis]